MALLDGGRRTASVRARTDTNTLEVSAAFFQALLGEMDLPAYRILRRIIHDLADRLGDVRCRIIEQMERRIVDRVYQPARETLQAGAGQVAENPFNFRQFLPLLLFFNLFLESEIDRLLLLGKVVTKPKQALLFDEGDSPNAAYLVLRGCVDRGVWRRGRVRTSLTGPGRICGANEMLSGRDRGTSATALTDSLLLELDHSAFERLFTGNAAECLRFQNAIGIDQIKNLKSANNLLALLTNLEHIRHGPRLASVS